MAKQAELSEIGKKIQVLIKEKRLTQKEVAEYLGIDHATFSRKLREVEIDVKYLLKLNDLLQYDFINDKNMVADSPESFVSKSEFAALNQELGKLKFENEKLKEENEKLRKELGK
jgi:transcriptional regulator with XRE-family HTH domain